MGNGNDCVNEGNAHGQLIAEFRALQEGLTLVQTKLNIVQTIVQTKLDSHEKDIACMTDIVEPITLHIINAWMLKDYVVPNIQPDQLPRRSGPTGIHCQKLISQSRSSAELVSAMKFGDVSELEHFATMWSDIVSSPSLQIHYPLVALAKGLWESGPKPILFGTTLRTTWGQTWLSWPSDTPSRRRRRRSYARASRSSGKLMPTIGMGWRRI